MLRDFQRCRSFAPNLFVPLYRCQIRVELGRCGSLSPSAFYLLLTQQLIVSSFLCSSVIIRILHRISRLRMIPFFVLFVLCVVFLSAFFAFFCVFLLFVVIETAPSWWTIRRRRQRSTRVVGQRARSSKAGSPRLTVRRGPRNSDSGRELMPRAIL